jgi:hypothetical protein
MRRTIHTSLFFLKAEREKSGLFLSAESLLFMTFLFNNQSKKKQMYFKRFQPFERHFDPSIAKVFL